jgi:L-lactate dehydrogenase
MMPDRRNRPVRVAVVGAGHVGATFAYALMFSGLASEIVLVDANRARAEGEAMDLNHTEPFTRATRVWAGDYSDCAESAVVVLAAGAGQKPGETRLDLAKRNAEIFAEIVPQIARYAPETILLVTTNPVDVLTSLALRLSGFRAQRVIGSGTVLDTARFRHLLGRHFHVDTHSVHAFIAGEHGDSEVPLWSLANVAGVPLDQFGSLLGVHWDESVKREIFTQTRDAAYHIIERKGATHFAVAAGILRIVEAVLRDQHTVLSVGSQVEDFYGISGVSFSLPTLLSRAGIERQLRLNLAEDEVAGLRRSEEILRDIMDGLPSQRAA